MDKSWKLKKMSKEEMKKTLSALEYKVTQEEATEEPFKNQYWDNHEDGIYVDVVSGEPLFSSLDKYDSGSGWPSFTRPLDEKNIVTRSDSKMATERIEVRTKESDSHLGHVFDDGPGPDHKRFCVNSASLRFIPKSKMKEEGYGQLTTIFERKIETKAGNKTEK